MSFCLLVFFFYNFNHIKEYACLRWPWWLQFFFKCWFITFNGILFFSGIAYHLWLMLSVLTTKGNLEKNSNLLFYTSTTLEPSISLSVYNRNPVSRGICFTSAFNQPPSMFLQNQVMWPLWVQSHQRIVTPKS